MFGRLPGHPERRIVDWPVQDGAGERPILVVANTKPYYSKGNRVEGIPVRIVEFELPEGKELS